MFLAEGKQEKGVMSISKGSKVKKRKERREYEEYYSGELLAMEFGREKEVGGEGRRMEECASLVLGFGVFFIWVEREVREWIWLLALVDSNEWWEWLVGVSLHMTFFIQRENNYIIHNIWLLSSFFQSLRKKNYLTSC